MTMQCVSLCLQHTSSNTDLVSSRARHLASHLHAQHSSLSDALRRSPIAVAEYYDSFDVLRWLLQVDERYKDGNPNWFDDAADAEHVRALAAARAEAEARRLAEEADKRAREAADADAKKKAEEEAAAQRAKAEAEAAERKRAEVRFSSSIKSNDNSNKSNNNNKNNICHVYKFRDDPN